MPVYCLNPDHQPPKRVRSRRARLPHPLCQDCDCKSVRLRLGLPLLLCAEPGCAASVTRGRGLCDVHHADLTVRARHAPIQAPQGNRASQPDDDQAERPLPRRPTSAAPHSPEKMGVLAARAAASPAIQLHHPYDARTIPDSRSISRARKLFASHIEAA